MKIISQKNLLLVSILLLSYFSKAQFKEFDLKDTITAKKQNYVIYLNAVWCKPCMDDMGTMIDSFKHVPNYKFIVLFERSYLDESLDLQQKLIKKFGDSLFYFIPSRYYSKPKMISINPQDKVMKKFIKDINEVSLSNLKFPGYAWGHLAILKDGTYKASIQIDKQKQIAEIKALLNQ